VLISKKIANRLFLPLGPIIKSLLASVAAGLTMFAFIKFFDRWVWLKNFYFFGSLEGTKLDFERFVLDTRYTLNLMILTLVALLGGALVYLGVSLLLKSNELWAFVYLIKHRTLKSPAQKEVEQITQTNSL
jgi:hypothetical protein